MYFEIYSLPKIGVIKSPSAKIKLDFGNKGNIGYYI
jgi:hypothetical protein